MSQFKNFPPIYNNLGEEAGKLPILDLKGERGFTDYIDFIKAEDMDCPIMIGIDCYNRHFMAIKVKTNNDKYIVGTFFQRYTNDSYTWAYGTCYPGNTIFYKSRFHTDEDITTLTERLHNLFYNKTVNVYDKPYKDMVNGDGSGTITLVY